jgi:hypothetical protein
MAAKVHEEAAAETEAEVEEPAAEVEEEALPEPEEELVAAPIAAAEAEEKNVVEE